MKKNKIGYVRLKCSKCNEINYTTTRATANQEKLALSKFCKRCKLHTPHTETKIK